MTSESDKKIIFSSGKPHLEADCVRVPGMPVTHCSLHVEVTSSFLSRARLTISEASGMGKLLLSNS